MVRKFSCLHTHRGLIMWRSSAYSAAVVCGLKRQLRTSVEHAHSKVASIRGAERRKYAIPRLPSIRGTRACRPLAQASCRLISEQGPVMLGRPQRSRGNTATRRSESQVWPGRALSARRFYRHSRHLAGGACHRAVASAPATDKRQVNTRV